MYYPCTDELCVYLSMLSIITHLSERDFILRLSLGFNLVLAPINFPYQNSKQCQSQVSLTLTALD